MKRSYLYLFLTILLFTFNVSALNSEDKNITDNNKTTNKYKNTFKNQSRSRSYHFDDANGFIIEIHEDGKATDHMGHIPAKFYWNGKLIGKGWICASSGRIEYLFKFHSSEFRIDFPGGEYKLTPSCMLYFGVDGYVYPERDFLKNGDKKWRLKYRIYQ